MQAGIHKRPRVPNACIRCRQQKIKCSGSRPCGQCSKRAVTCKFDTSNHKVLVDARFIARLQREAVQNSAFGWSDSEDQNPPSRDVRPGHVPISGVGGRDLDNVTPSRDELAPDDPGSRPPAIEQRDSDQPIESESTTPYPQDSSAADSSLVNPLVTGNSTSYTVNADGQPVYLGTSSNWSFGRRVLSMVHERVNGTSLPSTSLHFQGTAYDLGWTGLRDGEPIDCSSLPAADYAIFLINAVKFHCSRLFHIFDESTFMAQFAAFHEQAEGEKKPPVLWFVHYLLILAFGKAFIVRTARVRSLPGADLFTRAMKLLPDITFLHSDPIQAIEVLICAALYLQCLDLRSVAFNVVSGIYRVYQLAWDTDVQQIGQAMRLAVEQGLHTDMLGRDQADEVVQRCRDIWWTVYILDRRMTSLMGTPLSICDSDISASLPACPDSTKKSLALSHHVQLSKATSTILRSMILCIYQTHVARSANLHSAIYGKNSKNERPFLKSVKDALMTVAEGSDEREKVFPLNLSHSSSGIDRLSAYLHIFHHQKRVNSSDSFRITAEGGARSLSRVCVSSAKQTLRILKALQNQGLLAAVDESLLRSRDSWLQIAYELLDEMKSRGSVIAGFHISELQQLAINIGKLQSASRKPDPGNDQTEVSDPTDPGTNIITDGVTAVTGLSSTELGVLAEPAEFSSSEDGLLNANELQSVAEAFDFDQIDYLQAAGDFDGPLSSL